MPVPEFVCGVVYASVFALSVDDDMPRDTRSIVWKMRPNSVTLEKGILGTRMHAVYDDNSASSHVLQRKDT
jgi:hypothetical protein